MIGRVSGVVTYMLSVVFSSIGGISLTTTFFHLFFNVSNVIPYKYCCFEYLNAGVSGDVYVIRI